MARPGRPRISPPVNAFGRHLEAAGITDAQAAHELGVTPAYIGMLRRGAALPGWALIDKIVQWSAGEVPYESWRE